MCCSQVIQELRQEAEALGGCDQWLMRQSYRIPVAIKKNWPPYPSLIAKTRGEANHFFYHLRKKKLVCLLAYYLTLAAFATDYVYIGDSNIGDRITIFCAGHAILTETFSSASLMSKSKVVYMFCGWLSLSTTDSTRVMNTTTNTNCSRRNYCFSARRVARGSSVHETRHFNAN